MAVGVDVGGSGVRVGRVVAGEVVDVAREPLGDPDPLAVLARIADVAARLGPGEPVGVGLPGQVRGGVVLDLPNRPGWRGVPAARLLAERLGVPVAVDNDATVAAAGVWQRRGRPADLLVATVGTGVGAGIVAGGRLLRGTSGELGHVWAGGERRCGCGRIGCLETIAGTVGLRAAAAEAGHVVADGEAVVAAARASAPWALAVVDAAGVALGRALGGAANLVDPAEVVIIGGLALAEDVLGAPVARGFAAVALDAVRARPTFLGRADEVAVLGAGLIASGALGEASA